MVHWDDKGCMGEARWCMGMIKGAWGRQGGAWGRNGCMGGMLGNATDDLEGVWMALGLLRGAWGLGVAWEGALLNSSKETA